ncbi:MAG: small subunit ribosomal protein S20 [Parcubacteria group bacterium Athens0714_25]|nr:MAG: small subunit ribosomal protein S20 [Parcubacteria group bacterium Athens0714_25]
MPIKKSAKKYMRVTDKKTARNKIVKGVFRSAIKKTRDAITEKNIEKAQEWLKKSIKSLDKAVQKKTLVKNTAARYKSRLNKAVKELAGKK